MVGLHNSYWYYGSQTYKQESTDKLVHTSEAFQGSDLIILQITSVTFFLTEITFVMITHLLSIFSNPLELFITVNYFGLSLVLGLSHIYVIVLGYTTTSF